MAGKKRIPQSVTIWIGDCAQSIVDTAEEMQIEPDQVLARVVNEVNAIIGRRC